jgi:hypothetical protein
MGVSCYRIAWEAYFLFSFWKCSFVTCVGCRRGDHPKVQLLSDASKMRLELWLLCQLQYKTFSTDSLTQLATDLSCLWQIQGEFYAHGSVHRESTLKCSNKMILFVHYFIPCRQLYMFRVKHSPIIRSSNKLQLQHLVVTNSMRPAVVLDESEWVPTHPRRLCHYRML